MAEVTGTEDSEKFGVVWFLEYASERTDRQTDTLITILRSPHGTE